MFGMAASDGYLDFNPFHDLKTPRVAGSRAIKVATQDQFLKVRASLPNVPCKVFSTLMVSSGVRFCEAIGLRPGDFDFGACLLEVTRSVVKVSRKHHPDGKTFLVRDCTKNGQTRVLKLDRAVSEMVRAHVEEHGIGGKDVIFPAALLSPPRKAKPRLSEQEIAALGDRGPVNGRVYAHGTMGGYVRAKCRCDGRRQLQPQRRQPRSSSSGCPGQGHPAELATSINPGRADARNSDSRQLRMTRDDSATWS